MHEEDNASKAKLKAGYFFPGRWSVWNQTLPAIAYRRRKPRDTCAPACKREWSTSLVPTFSHQAVRLGPGTPDRDGVLVFHHGDLVAVLVQLTHETHDGLGGQWFLEAGFGCCTDKNAPLFESPEEAEGWISRQMRKVAPDRPRLASLQ